MAGNGKKRNISLIRGRDRCNMKKRDVVVNNVAFKSQDRMSWRNTDRQNMAEQNTVVVNVDFKLHKV